MYLSNFSLSLIPSPIHCVLPMQILKRNEQMYALLACVVGLCPAAAKSMDENVSTQASGMLHKGQEKVTSGTFQARLLSFSGKCWAGGLHVAIRG